MEDQINLRRREFIAALGGAAAWPLAARCAADVAVGTRVASRPPHRPVRAAFPHTVPTSGTDNQALRLDVCSPAPVTRLPGAESGGRRPNPSPQAPEQNTIGIERVACCNAAADVDASDPVGSGLVASLARPGGNLTGFALFEHGFGAKWLELLKRAHHAPRRRGGLAACGRRATARPRAAHRRGPAVRRK
jgi:putative ABC transport system substrate-binding protein